MVQMVQNGAEFDLFTDAPSVSTRIAESGYGRAGPQNGEASIV